MLEIVLFKTEDVDVDGNVANGVVVCVEGYERQSPLHGGCGLEGCNCSIGHWVTKVYPRTSDGVVAGFRVNFKDREELERYSMEDLELAALEARRQTLSSSRRRNINPPTKRAFKIPG